MKSENSYQIPQLQIDKFQAYRERMNSSLSEKAQSIFPYIQDIQSSTKKILSIGPGGGALEREMLKVFYDQRILAVDYSLPMIEDLQHSQQKTEQKTSSIECIAAIANLMPLKDNSVSAIVASSVIHEIATFGDNFTFGEKVNQFFLEAQRVLVPGGRLIIRDFMQYPQAEQIITLVVGEQQINDPSDPADFLKNFVNDFKGSDLSYIRQQLPKEILPGTKIEVNLKDALEIAGHFSWSHRYADEVKERYAYFSVDQYAAYIENLLSKHGIKIKLVDKKTIFQSGYAEHINGRLNFYPNGTDHAPCPPILTGYVVVEKQ